MHGGAVLDDEPAGRRRCAARETGPQRSHASTGSDSAPGEARSRRAARPRDRRRRRPTARRSPRSRPRHAAPPRVATSSASRADIEPAPWRSLPCSIAVRASSHSEAESVDDDPSHAQPHRGPGGAQLRHRRQPAAQDHVGRRAVRRPHPRRAQPGDLLARPATRSAPATPGRSASRRRRSSRPDGGRTGRGRTRPRRASRTGGCAAGRRAARRAPPSASSATVETLNGEHGASAIRVIAAGARSWCAATSRSRVGEDLVVVLHDRVRGQPAVLHRQRHRAAGRVEPEAQLAGRRDLGRDRSPPPRGCT